jgi:hypothetical protein
LALFHHGGDGGGVDDLFFEYDNDRSGGEF